MNFFDLTSLNYQIAESSYNKFESLVAELMKLLKEGIIFHCGYSTGKDSSVVVNAAIEAMRRCLDNEDIEADRPLVVVTVDTLLEPSNIQMYVPFAHQQVRDLCEAHGINLHLKLVSPPMHQHLMVLYAGSQKLFTSSASGRKADCSSLWKVEVGKRALEETRQYLPEEYRNGKWANLSGVRIDESTRRKSNMSKRGEADLTADSLIEQIRSEGEGYGYHRFAPIANWTTRDVIDCLNHAGDTPMKKMPSGLHIPCYGKNFGLLLAIYGEGSNDVCQVGESGSCGGVARYGCQTCGMVSEDHSGKEMLQYPRWARFGDDVLRLRDYLFRTSLNVNNRAFHPRATCSVTSNVYLQPNVLKATILENILYQAAQITEKHRQIHADFVSNLNNGNVSTDVGVMDIQSDPTLREDVKLDYVDAYVSRMSEKPMLELFTEQHAVMLSALWSLHGVKAAPYRPMKILDNVQNGHRKPLPPLNAELNALRAKQGLLEWDDTKVLNKEVPDALVFQLFAPAKKFDSNISQIDELAHWMPLNFTKSTSHHMAPLLRDLGHDLIHRDRLRPVNTLVVKVKLATDGTNHKLTVNKATSSGKLNLVEGSAAYQELLTLAQKKAQTELAKISTQYNITSDAVLADVVKLDGMFEIEFHAELPFAKEFTTAFSGVSAHARSRKETGMRFTKRKRNKQKDGVFTAGRTSLQDYNPSVVPLLVEQHQTQVGYWLPDNKETRAQHFSLYDYNMDADFVQGLAVSMDFESKKFNVFMKKHWSTAIARHDAYVREGFTNRLGARKYTGTGVFHSLMKNSGLSMAPRFQEYVNQSLVRTEIFHASHLYNLSDRNYHDVLNASHVISMTEHRSQKANQLLAVRKVRNIKRAELQFKLNTQLPGSHASIICRRVIEFLSHYEEQAFAMAIHASHQGLANKPSPSLRGCVNQMWVSEFSPVASNFKELLKLVTTASELAVLKADLTAMTSVFNTYKSKLTLVESSLQARCATIVDCLVGTQQNTDVSDFVDDGMGNMEFLDESLVTPIVEAYLAVGATRNRFLTEMGLSNVLAASKGVGARDKHIAATCYDSAIANLHSTARSLASTLQEVNYDQALRNVVTLECRTSTIMTLSQEKQDRLAALRAAS
ncbi:MULTISPECIES: phosphoadenosine phosphosulfate reductase domain-containing protein [Vibrio]|uniref:phosphoadenosine phosphosulfate reductase domain-containing protein n=1 Tax=Vibrio TaxID=662 RepID=UPI002074F7BA|nr:MULTISPECIES: phosphoadenosine phosphosulfate reductase family protein [Vibrio]USD35619.1 phosphoadenosine phosphosulfate reductase family protein [Vibrio sp. SCSIO 43186]USD72743.1 phosphoadenosine phosphosulfate reductase family protein [Vibrio sp. SCSIO 43139]